MHYISGLYLKLQVLFFFLLFTEILFSQSHTGKVISSETDHGIGYVNVGVIGKNVGTVSDEYGNFTLNIDKKYDNDTIRFSILGYESKTMLVSHFRKSHIKNVFLNPISYTLPDIKVMYHRPKKRMLGHPVLTDALRSGFSENQLGSELGIRANARRRVLLKDINMNVAICTYDSVTYRLNIYLIEDNIVCNNILTEPIYISFSKEEINNVLTFDLSEYSIVFDGDVLITLELYKDIGIGKLLFRTEYFTGLTYHRKTSEGNWTQSPGVVGIYLNCLVKE